MIHFFAEILEKAGECHGHHDNLRRASESLVQQIAHLREYFEGAICVLLKDQGHHALINQGFEEDRLAALHGVYLIQKRFKDDYPLIDYVNIR